MDFPKPPMSRRQRLRLANALAWPVAGIMVLSFFLVSSLLLLKLLVSVLILAIAGAIVWWFGIRRVPSQRASAHASVVPSHGGGGNTPSGPLVGPDLSASGVTRLIHDRDEFKELVDHLPFHLFTVDRQGAVLYIHRADETDLGMRIGSPIESLVRADDQGPLRVAIDTMFRTRAIQQLQARQATEDDSAAWWTLTLVPVEQPDHSFHGLMIATDITQQKLMEEKMRQGQRMEAIGRLSSGVGHDFNNILTVIQCNALLMQDMAQRDGQDFSELEEILDSVERASRLTHQLLAFSRSQAVRPKMLSLNDVVENLLKMLNRLIGENIQLRFQHDEALPKVRGDETQLEQVIMNLMVNARDAMPQGGRLTVRTGVKLFAEDQVHVHGTIEAGEYVSLQVTDTGEGIDLETLPRIFEPYFTTKKSGRGYGLGLSTVYGIVTQHGGGITCSSTRNFGTSFTLYLPVATGEDPKSPSARLGAAMFESRRPATVLLVEDEPQVRTVAVRVLERQGYDVLCAENADQAVELATAHAGTIDLLFTDIVMPDRNGAELAHEIVGQRPGIRVLFTSGYTDSVALSHGIEPSAIYFLPKPYTAGELTRKIVEILESSMIIEVEA